MIPGRRGSSEPASAIYVIGERLGAQPWAGENLVLHKLRVHPDSVARFFPPLRRGGQGGWSRRNQGLVRGSGAAGPRGGTRRRAGSAASAEAAGYALFSPPDWPLPVTAVTPPSQGGKGIARAVIQSRATKTRLSKPSLDHGQHQLFTTPAQPHPESGFSPPAIVFASFGRMVQRHYRSRITTQTDRDRRS
jgi:hypothetical protein